MLIGHPGGAAEGPRPVVVLADPWAAFGSVIETVRLFRLGGMLPDMVVVGVGYRSARMDDIMRLRTRDLTPTAVASRISEDQPTTMMGGADRFLAFLRDELAPWLNGRHGADPGDATFVGYSLGGLFATHVLLTDPSAFRRYAIGSPSLWWDDGVTFAHEAVYAAANSDLAARVHFSVGELETLAGRRRFVEQLPPAARAIAEAEDAADAPVDMVADMQRMVELLRGRGYASLELESEVLAEAYHETAAPQALSRALRWLYRAPL